MKKEKLPFYVVKIKTGETLFAEITDFSDKDLITMREPMLIRMQPNEGSGESIYAVPWVPFADQDRVVITMNMVYYMDYLNEKFVEFYGSVLLQQKISEIKHEVAESMEDGNDYYAMMEGVERIKRASEEISSKFNMANNVDTSNFEEQAAKRRPVLN